MWNWIEKLFSSKQVVILEVGYTYAWVDKDPYKEPCYIHVLDAKQGYVNFVYIVRHNGKLTHTKRYSTIAKTTVFKKVTNIDNEYYQYTLRRFIK